MNRLRDCRAQSGPEQTAGERVAAREQRRRDRFENFTLVEQLVEGKFPFELPASNHENFVFRDLRRDRHATPFAVLRAVARFYFE